MGHSFDPKYLIPYIQMHEFEALLFSDPVKCSAGLYEAQIAEPMQRIRDQFPSPEHINDGPETAPSKRILGLFHRYDKPLYGCLACHEIGIRTIRQECYHFDEWVTRLEKLTP
jgi:hypothetical protein